MAGAKDLTTKASEAVLVSKPQNGSVTINSRDGTYSSSPNKGFYGLENFTFMIKKKASHSKVETAESKYALR
jgi:hypothetical protein